MAREYRNFTREEKIKAVKMVLVDKKSQMEVEKTILGKKEMYRYN
jgi:transposase-like protein